MDKNMLLYNAVRAVPPEARKQIKGGRLNGMTDINPMWGFRVLTEQFGACGVGWKYEIVRLWTETGADGNIAAFCQIDLYYRDDDDWSAPIPGIGGSAFVSKESKGMYTSDECYKMALTDAISVACKALGVGADVYWEAGSTKYSSGSAEVKCPKCGDVIKPIRKNDGTVSSPQDILSGCGGMCYKCYKAERN